MASETNWSRMRAYIHAGAIVFALLFRWLTPHHALMLAGAGCIFNLIFLPVLLPQLHRENEKNVTSGIFLYPLAVLLLVATLPLHVAAAAWAMMALGDAAACLFGGGARWPWNPRKSFAGSVMFLVAAIPGSAALWYWVSFSKPPWPKLLIAAVVAMLVESLPLPIPDDITVPIAPALILGTFVPSVLFSPVGAAVSAVFAAVALAARLVTISGAIAGFLISVLLYSYGGWQAFALLFAFFAIGSGTTRLLYARKQSMSLSERRKGARVAEQAVANAGAAVFFALIGQPVAVAASLAAATADTVATEIGPLLGGRVYLLSNGNVVKPGTSGGVSIAGTIVGAIGAAVVTAIAVSIGALRSGEFLMVMLGAVTGSAVDSLLGSTFEKDGWLNNEGVNFLGTLAAGLIAMGMFR